MTPGKKILNIKEKTYSFVNKRKYLSIQMEILMLDIKSHSWLSRLSSPFCIRALFHVASCRRQRCHSKVEPTSDIFLRCTSRRQ